MDLEFAMRFLHQKLSSITAEVFYEFNRKEIVVYPYLTYTMTSATQDVVSEEYTMELNLFDYGTSKINLLNLESDIKNALNRRRFIEKEALIRIRTDVGQDIPTGDPTIQRRDLMLNIKIDWRELHG